MSFKIIKFFKNLEKLVVTFQKFGNLDSSNNQRENLKFIQQNI